MPYSDTHFIPFFLSFFLSFFFKMNELNSLESKNEQKKQDLEKSILALKTSISKYDTEYNRNLELLNSVSEMLMNLLKNVRNSISHLNHFLRLTNNFAVDCSWRLMKSSWTSNCSPRESLTVTSTPSSDW